MPSIKITADKALWEWGQVGDIVDNFRFEWLPVDVKNGVAVDIKPEYVSAVDWTALLGF